VVGVVVLRHRRRGARGYLGRFTRGPGHAGVPRDWVGAPRPVGHLPSVALRPVLPVFRLNHGPHGSWLARRAPQQSSLVRLTAGLAPANQKG